MPERKNTTLLSVIEKKMALQAIQLQRDAHDDKEDTKKNFNQIGFVGLSRFCISLKRIIEIQHEKKCWIVVGVVVVVVWLPVYCIPHRRRRNVAYFVPAFLSVFLYTFFLYFFFLFVEE